MTVQEKEYKSAYQQGYSDAMHDFRKKPSRDMKEIEEVINCDADAETKCKMISNILTAEHHYFEEAMYCDRNICALNEYNGIGCDDCEVAKSQDVINRQAVLSMQYRIDDSATLSTRDVVNVDDIEDLPPVNPQPKMQQWILVDKIRDEIEKLLPTKKCTETRRIYINADDFKKKVLAILDKVQGKSEEI